MTALTADRNTPQSLGPRRVGLIAAATTAFSGAMLMRNAAGFIVEGQTATGLVGVGRAQEHVDNAAGSNGDFTVAYEPGIYRYDNSASTDEITEADIGKVCFAVDDQTVAKTDGTGTRSPAGVVDHVDDLGVWVRFDEALTRAAAA
jgi:hypothetical protein